MEEIASDGVVEPYQYESLEGEDSHSPCNSADNGAQDDERLHNLNWSA